MVLKIRTSLDKGRGGLKIQDFGGRPRPQLMAFHSSFIEFC